MEFRIHMEISFSESVTIPNCFSILLLSHLLLISVAGYQYNMEQFFGFVAPILTIIAVSQIISR